MNEKREKFKRLLQEAREEQEQEEEERDRSPTLPEINVNVALGHIPEAKKSIPPTWGSKGKIGTIGGAVVSLALIVIQILRSAGYLP